MERYEVTITGQSPLLMHQDDLEWRGKIDAWLRVAENKKNSKAGDDRTPAWKWIGYCYRDAHHVGIPSDNLMTLLREGGAKVPTGKKGATFKRQSQSGLIVDAMLWPLTIPNGVVPWQPILDLMTEPDYLAHEARALALGFVLFAKGVKVGQSKHIRVRPRFDAWSATGTISVLDDSITEDVLRSILEMGGMYCGLGDWRPSSPSKPGPFGRFTSQIRKV